MAAMLMATGAMAQKMIIKVGGELVRYNVQGIDYVMFEELKPNYYAWVDLGLPSGTLWATCNVGADSPEQSGDYFAWGETKKKSSYSWGNYLWMNEGKSNWEYINKYTRADGQTTGCWYSDDTFIGDNKTELELPDDAAAINWNCDWQMPSYEQFAELINEDYTTTEWTTQNDVNGRKITSKSNGNSIFLPASGVIWDDKGVSNAGRLGYYWSRSLSTINDRAVSLVIRSEYAFTNNSDRYEGRCIRPVRVEKVVKEHEYVDLGLPSGTLWATCNVGAGKPEEYGQYFAWGMIESKEPDYHYYEEKYYNGGLTELLPEDDAATANWGAPWHMPTKEQIEELIDNCSTEWTQQNGVNGRLVTGSNGSQIFLPAAGWCDRGSWSWYREAGYVGFYLSSSLGQEYNSDAYGLLVRSGLFESCEPYRDWGCSVRPVRKK